MATSDHKNATISHEMRFDRQTLWKGCDFDGPAAILMREMKFDRQKLECKSVCVTSSHLLHLFFSSLTLFLLPSLLHSALVLQPFLSSRCRSVSVDVLMPLFSFHLSIAISRYQCLFFYSHHILLTYSLHCFYLHLSNLLLYGLGTSVV